MPNHRMTYFQTIQKETNLGLRERALKSCERVLGLNEMALVSHKRHPKLQEMTLHGNAKELSGVSVLVFRRRQILGCVRGL